jgi:hypothetical protein
LLAYRAYKRDLDMLHDSLEQTEDQKAFVKEMKSANKVLKKQKMTSSIDSVENMLDDMDEHREDMEEFHNTLTSRTTGSAEIDDELAALFGDDERPISLTLPSSSVSIAESMPLVPAVAPAVAPAVGELGELAELELDELDNVLAPPGPGRVADTI